MVFEKERHPAAASITLHPFRIILLQVVQIVAIVVKTGMSRRFQMIKGENHVQLMPVLPGKKPGHLHSHPRRLPHGKSVGSVKRLTAQLPQIIMKMGAVKIMLNSHIAHHFSHAFIAVGKPFLLGNIVDNIQAEAVHALFQPPFYHGNDFGAQPGIIPV